MPQDQPRDPNVLTFMMGLVQQKHGDDIDIDFLNSEAARLYDQFGDKLVDYFEPMLTDDQKQNFDNMIDKGESQDKILEFLMSSISNLDQKIQQVLFNFRDAYLQSEQ